ncbi:cation-translocating P-type ATPase [Dielma fastidiosa]|uniref:cation-translocating P-type ATPase n=1 Tax=Dielma fastidiosa TaxID=1034346 RepID=UPI000E4FBCEB|nr:cation-translocating P-type ATPase [Dielma fastidiosa]RHN03069.1 cation-translocating P-type ATPase [Dielma fastidiosa]
MINQTKQELEKALNVDTSIGLGSEEVKKRQAKDGFNELEQPKKASLFVRFMLQFKDTLVIILLIAALVSVLVEPGDWIDSAIIVFVVVVNAILGVVQESKAEKSLEALQKLSAPNAKVLRDGKKCVVPARELVVGDVLVLEAGDCVPSDARIVECHNLKVDESALTGESLPVEKNDEIIDKTEVALGDKTNMVFQSCNVTYGRAIAIVTSIGMQNEVGKIAGMLLAAKQEATPLQNKLDEIGKMIGIMCIGICIVVFGMEMLSGLSALDAFKTSVALAVAAIPEGLATVVTIVLALSVQKMVKQNAIVRRLPAVETLGSTSIVCSDKTGTLTQNKMTVVKTYTPAMGLRSFEETEDHEAIDMLNYFTLCSDAELIEENGQLIEIGDPTETALVAASLKKGFSKEKLAETYQRDAELAFDSERKMMTVFYKLNGQILSITKGGPDVTLARCVNADITKAMAANDEMANDALRVLAVAVRVWDQIPEKLTSELIENDLTFIGLVGMIDPPRPEVKDAVAVAAKAGVRTIMITGDHITTAVAIAKNLGILTAGQKAIMGVELDKMSQEELESHIDEYSVYARVAPEHKVRIVKAWQAQGHIVAMTGDGVNDAPALKSADIGCAMGITGTDVAKGAAAMILTDDNFATIISSIREGRGIFDNIKKDVQYLLSSNIGEVLVIFGASLISVLIPASGFGVPLLPIHLLWVNLITDSLPAFALGMEPTEADVMNRKPRKKDEDFFAHGFLWTIIWQGIMVGVLTLCSYALGENVSHEYGMTMAFITLVGCQLFHSFNVKSHHSVFSKQIFNNKYLWGAAAVGVLLQVLIINVPFLSDIFKLVPLDPIHALEAIGISALTVVFVEIYKLIKRIQHKD